MRHWSAIDIAIVLVVAGLVACAIILAIGVVAERSVAGRTATAASRHRMLSPGSTASRRRS
jgi:Mn2+/Fe2+ NRAMP family transporter